jgi:GT2 family glycosyltransferase
VEALIVDDRREKSVELKVSREGPRNLSIRILQGAGLSGFAAAVNLGARAAKAPLLLILNDDVTLGEASISELCQATVKRPLAAVFQAKVLSADDPKVFEYAGAAGGLIDRYGYPYCRGRVLFQCEVDEGQFDYEAPIFWAAGCALLIRREAYDACGGLYEGFFMHMEEIDLCWRLWRSGSECWSVPQAVVYHQGGGTLARGSFRKSWWNHRNHWLLIFRNLDRWPLVHAILMRVILDALEIAWSITTQRWSNALAVALASPWPIFNIRRLREARRNAAGSYQLPNAAPVYPGSMVLAAAMGRDRTKLYGR